MRQPAALAFMLGSDSPETLADLRAAMLRWSEQTGDRTMDMHRFMGLGTPRLTRLDRRDALLAEVFDHLEGTRWARCRQLAEMARTFNTRRWPVWQRDGLPAGAAPVDVLLFRACEVIESLPETPHGWRDIMLKQTAAAG